jgi:D-lactate dehydrogenase (cytochrome)
VTADLDFLTDLLPSNRRSLASDDRAEYAEDWGRSGGEPDAVVWAESTDDVSRVLAACDARGVPVTPYAAGSGIEGGALATEGGVTLDTTRLNSCGPVRAEDLQLDAGAGAVGGDVEAAAAEHGLFCPPFPQSAAFSTVGGMAATGASGTKTVKYGEVGDWILGLEAVLADGTVIETGSRARKSSSGYDLTALLVGSEGTLAVVTRVRLALAPKPPARRAGRATFETLDDAAAAVSLVVQEGIDVATLELVDPLTARMVSAYADTAVSPDPSVFVEIHAGTKAGADAKTARCVGALERAGGTVEFADDPDEMERIWAARRQAADAIKAWDESRTPLTVGDVTVPIGSFPEMVRSVRSIGAEYGFDVPAFGHAGDGNVHYAVLVDPDDPEDVARGKDASDRIVERALDLEGTSTGEHGVGLGKRSYMKREHGAGAVGAMQAVKRALDPNGTLNPESGLPALADRPED